jgi:hypothetical protein
MHRRFSVHLFWVSHGLLLLRSGKVDGEGTRIDVLFQDVIWMCLPAWLNRLTIKEVNLADAAFRVPRSIESEVAGRHVYALETEDGTHHVIAGSVTIADDNLEYFEPSSLLPGIGFPSTGP